MRDTAIDRFVAEFFFTFLFFFCVIIIYLLFFYGDAGGFSLFFLRFKPAFRRKIFFGLNWIQRPERINAEDYRRHYRIIGLERILFSFFTFDLEEIRKKHISFVRHLLLSL